MPLEQYQNREVDQHEKLNDLERNIDSKKNSNIAPNTIENGMSVCINRKGI